MGKSKGNPDSPFRGLKRALEEKSKERELRKGREKALKPGPEEKPEETMAERDTPEAAFEEAMKDVREIKEFRSLPVEQPRRAPVRPEAGHDDEGEAHRELLAIVRRQKPITISDTDEYMHWAAPSLPSHKKAELTRELHEGRYAINDFIDLHGLTEDEAWDSFGLFMKEAARRNLSCVKVIHGRGLRSPREPVLKSAVARWLKGPFSKYVLAYSTARATDGGLGATYVLLKRR